VSIDNNNPKTSAREAFSDKRAGDAAADDNNLGLPRLILKVFDLQQPCSRPAQGVPEGCS
jgi:hypothetical protein